MFVNLCVYINLSLFSSILYRLLLYLRSRNRKTERQEKKWKKRPHTQKKKKRQHTQSSPTPSALGNGAHSCLCDGPWILVPAGRPYVCFGQDLAIPQTNSLYTFHCISLLLFLLGTLWNIFLKRSMSYNFTLVNCICL